VDNVSSDGEKSATALSVTEDSPDPAEKSGGGGPAADPSAVGFAAAIKVVVLGRRVEPLWKHCLAAFVVACIPHALNNTVAYLLLGVFGT
jgi:hypothetical protein